MRRTRLHDRSSAFTLIELVIVLGILVMVLTATYRLIIDCLDAERTIDKLTLPEKVGEGILSLFRADVSGTIWRHSGTRVFFVIDNGSGRDARDEIRFLSTVEPTPVEEAGQGSTVQIAGVRTITGLAYFIKQNQGIDGVPTYTLFRKEIVDFTDENPLEAPGMNYEVYDKVAYLSIECYDPANLDRPWIPAWDSEMMIHDEQIDLEAQDQTSEGIARVGERDSARAQGGMSLDKAGNAGLKSAAAKPKGTSRVTASREQNALAQSAPGADPTLAEGEPSELLPPAAVPSAVRIEIGVYAGQGNRIERDAQGLPVLKVYATIVPILTAQRVRIESDDTDDSGQGAGGIGGPGDPGVSGVTPGGDPALGGITPLGGAMQPGGGRGSPNPGAPRSTGRGGRPAGGVAPGSKGAGKTLLPGPPRASR